jgi:hypothetical protein
MNKKQILAQLSKIANELDGLGLHDEADTTTDVMENLNEGGNPNPADPNSEGFDRLEKKLRFLFKQLRIFANRHNSELKETDLSLLDRKSLSNYFVDTLIEDVLAIDLTGKYYQPSIPKKPGFFDKLTSQFDRFKPKQEKQPHNELFNKYYGQSEQVIQEIEKTCKETLSTQLDSYEKRTFISRLEEIKNETIKLLEQKLYNNVY